MQIEISKWGNSLGVSIPKAFAVQAMLGEGSTADIYFDDGKIIIEPQNNKYELNEMLSEITIENLPDFEDEKSELSNKKDMFGILKNNKISDDKLLHIKEEWNESSF